jgi:ureidoacrylate peracid hydrolase
METDLPHHLDRLGTVHLVIAGMAATLCVEATGRHAAEHGYDVTFLRDAIGATNLAAYESAIRLSYPLIANAVLDVEDFTQVVTAGEGTRPRPGDEVIGCDQLSIGSIAEVVTDPDAPHLLVPRGILSNDVYIPLDAVTKAAPGSVFVNAPRILLGKLPWTEPPTAGQRREQLGPHSDTVEHLYGSRSPSLDAGP